MGQLAGPCRCVAAGMEWASGRRINSCDSQFSSMATANPDMLSTPACSAPQRAAGAPAGLQHAQHPSMRSAAPGAPVGLHHARHLVNLGGQAAGHNEVSLHIQPGPGQRAMVRGQWAVALGTQRGGKHKSSGQLAFRKGEGEGAASDRRAREPPGQQAVRGCDGGVATAGGATNQSPSSHQFSRPIS